MDNLCHRCNSEVAPGTPFCPQCGAPQIRVTAPASQASVSRIDSDEELHSIPSIPGHPESTIRWSSALPKTAVSGFATMALLILIASLTQMPAFLFLVIPLGGAFSVLLYSRGGNGQRLTTGAGARLGAVTGFFTFVFYSLKAAAEFSSHSEILHKAIQEAVAKSSEPQAQSVAQQLMTPTGFVTILIFVALVLLFVFLVLSSVGGAVGAAIFQSSRREED